jgi:hypothetical protein
MWAWEATAPGTAAAGVCDDMGRAQRTATEWMRANGADDGLLEQVRLAISAGSLLSHHEPTGVALHARRSSSGRIRWRLASTARAACGTCTS